MNILFITPYLPNSSKRRPNNFLTYLSKKHNITLIALAPRDKDLAWQNHWKKLGIDLQLVNHTSSSAALNVLLKGWSEEPWRVLWCKSEALKIKILEVLQTKKYDIVHLDRLRLAPYAELIPPDIPKILDFTDAMSLLYERAQNFNSWLTKIIAKHEAPAYKKFEVWALKQVEAGIICSSVDREAIISVYPDLEKKLSVIPNTVDINKFSPRQIIPERPAYCVFTGVLSYFPNVDSLRFFYQQIWSEVKKQCPHINLRIIGANPNATVKRIAASPAIELLPNVPCIEEELYSGDIFVCPLRIAAGMRQKLLEAMAAGMSIVSTPLGAEGIDVTNERELLIAPSPEEFIKAIVRLYNDKDLCIKLGQNARKLVENNYSLNIVGNKLEHLYEKIMKKLN